jgi:hypothetical protein
MSPFFKHRFSREWMDYVSLPREKMTIFVKHGFPRKGNNKSHLKFYMGNVVLHIYRMMLRMLGFAWMNTRLWGCWIGRYFGT